MGCNCGGSKSRTQEFVYVAPNGNRVVYKTEIEARAAQIRNGGGTYSAQTKR